MLAAREIAGELRHGLDPVAFAIERLRFEPDPWQAKVLRSSTRQLCTSTQSSGLRQLKK